MLTDLNEATERGSEFQAVLNNEYICLCVF